MGSKKTAGKKRSRKMRWKKSVKGVEAKRR